MNRIRDVNQLRAIHAKRLYEKNGDIMQALKAKHGNKNLVHDSVFDEGKRGRKHLEDNAEMIMKYSVDPENNEFKTLTPISLYTPVGDSNYKRDYEQTDGSWIQKKLYKGSGMIIEMSPDEFLSLATPLGKGDPDSLKHLREDMGKGEGEIPQLTTQSAGEHSPTDHIPIMSHEGRHRATIAKEKGYAKIPVFIESIHSDNPLTARDRLAISKHEFLKEEKRR